MIEACIRPRTREITDALGSRLRVSVDADRTGMSIMIERPDQRGRPHAVFDRRGAEMLSSHIAASRLASPGDLPDRRISGSFPSRLGMCREPRVALVATQARSERPLEIPAPFWDKLYVELRSIIDES